MTEVTPIEPRKIPEHFQKTGSGRVVVKDSGSSTASDELAGREAHMDSLRWGETPEAQKTRRTEEKKVSDLEQRPLLERIWTGISGLWGRV
jgi:hypothetical protein